MLKKDAIYVTSSRRNQIVKTVDIIRLDSLAPQLMSSSSTLKGGVEDQGNFKEGFCFKLDRPIGAKKEEMWILCAPEYKLKDTFMHQIAELRGNFGTIIKSVETEQAAEI